MIVESSSRERRFALGLIGLTIAALTLPFTTARAAELYPVTFQLNYPAAGFNAGFELAVKNGYYKDAGLDVKIEPGNGSQITAQLLAAGKVDLGFADSAPVMKLVSSGAKIKVLATILQGNPNQVTALTKSGIKSIAEIKGHSVAVPNAGSQSSMFPLVLAASGLKDSDIKLVNMPPDSMTAALIQGQVDVILGSIDYFAIQLKSLGADTVNFPFIEHGAPTVSTSIIASESFLAAHPDIAKKFVAASLKGWYAALDNPSDAVAAMKSMFPDASEKLAPAQLDATKYLMCVNRAKFVGKATPDQWSDTVKILSEIGILPADIPATTYYTYEFLPPDSELRPCPLK
ncbi:MAG: ABC transporter substrate-binding protein [Hyphomicrobiales bacterium]|nr:ABC transporter substrate-binding protein [Hyphomicrobiales bacterium]MBV9050849.1 ABC transporter substrate-binding protein [Hyphomicrobiales bacterium]MBV9974452.1 ABC transporter substrate-binding protein [Hyphomicrobiales bacterium]